MEEAIISNEPLVFNIGTSEILAQFHREHNRLIIELVQIVGGGEGVLLTLMNLIRIYAKMNAIGMVVWQIYARDCVAPNLKLRRLLELKKYEVKFIENKGEIYYKEEKITLK